MIAFSGILKPREVIRMRWKSVVSEIVPGALLLVAGLALSRGGTRKFKQGMDHFLGRRR